MLGFHSDGIRLFGASDTLKAQLKKRKLPLTGEITGNTLVFSINDDAIVQKRPYNISFAADSTPWFVCALGDHAALSPLTLRFETEAALVEFITAVYYASQEFLHLDIELSVLKQTLCRGIVRAYEKERFHKIPKDCPVICFYFGNGGFLETDSLFSQLTTTEGISIEQLTLAGSFASRRSFLWAFAAENMD
ncbi:hypothetical protein H9X85_05405 [Anaerotignum lactatifermentans]|uniref:FIST C-domain domain-containing protein n=1 Tax=Anaerotignum lactatifermentans TaxID=160404 RepID=A0ABS2G730_9FIRM|nr:hypothetical protein [Anaerotignum lactatifermentans]MBM6829116.1 hypothetical protein [Anaerotignum lactatifermentans]MBM6877276.1 hypothetical protein [Anaerotignum lactatifermentans]MBM6950649.1 hypothetical protein [Anaerotignum lactatifermentans]